MCVCVCTVHTDLLTCSVPVESRGGVLGFSHPYFACVCGVLVGVGVCTSACWLTCLHMWKTEVTLVFFLNHSQLFTFWERVPQRTQSTLTPLDCPKGHWASETYNKALKTKLKDGKISHVPGLTEYCKKNDYTIKTNLPIKTLMKIIQEFIWDHEYIKDYEQPKVRTLLKTLQYLASNNTTVLQ